MMKAEWFFLLASYYLLVLANAFSSSSSRTSSSSLDHSLSWKAFYEAAELRYVDLEHDTKEKIQQLHQELSTCQSQMEQAIQRAECVETKFQQSETCRQQEATYHETCRQQFLVDIRDLQDERDRLELRWSEECDRSEQTLVHVQREQALELQRVQEAAALQLQVTMTDYTAKLDTAQEQIRQLQCAMTDQERWIQKQSEYIIQLEQDRRSLRSLWNLSWQVCQQRVGRIVWRIFTRSGGGRHGPNGATSPHHRTKKHPSHKRMDEQDFMVTAIRRTNGGFP